MNHTEYQVSDDVGQSTCVSQDAIAQGQTVPRNDQSACCFLVIHYFSCFTCFKACITARFTTITYFT